MENLKDKIQIISCDSCDIKVLTLPDGDLTYHIDKVCDLKELFNQASELGIKWYTGDEMDFNEFANPFKPIKISFIDGFNRFKEMCIYATWG